MDVSPEGNPSATGLPPKLQQRLRKSLMDHSPNELPALFYSYGTAGYRGKAETLTHVMHRCGILSVLNAVATSQNLCEEVNPKEPGRSIVGAVITASHNPVEDNGVKLVDHRGSLYDAQWEKHASRLINASRSLCSDSSIPGCDESGREADNVIQQFSKLSSEMNVNWHVLDAASITVLVGRDTRPTSLHLSTIFAAGVEAVGANVKDFGTLTTPQLHFLVYCANIDRVPLRDISEQLYFEHFGERLRNFCQTVERAGLDRKPVGTVSTLFFDGANGVGGDKMEGFASCLHDCLKVNVHVVNSSGSTAPKGRGVLNRDCGAEHVQKTKTLPENFGSLFGMKPGSACCSVDGDADRLVYFSWETEPDGKHLLQVLDGDRIACLYSKCIIYLIERCVESTQVCGDLSDDVCALRIGVVQTAYANGSSTSYISRLSSEFRKREGCRQPVTIEIQCVKTGVKYLHSKALEYDVGIYFEANGHGTVHFNTKRLHTWAEMWNTSEAPGFKCLLSFLEVFNHTTGDAMVDVLATEMCRWLLGWDLLAWINIYKDVPSKQSKVSMKRKALSRLKPHPDHEKYLVEPRSLQVAIDTVISTVASQQSITPTELRAFIRPSGTEDVCRLFVEAPTEELCEEMTTSLQAVVEKHDMLADL
eukprot:GHVQ01039094.1.p1 GENE.GHVQ01039094.1~~GHVQ01039094.1.p1  ORF type:complete len:648 (-),score=62.82 GHVQ01039094.1:1861-3804(-)